MSGARNRLVFALLVLPLCGVGLAQKVKLNDKSKPRNHPVNCPYTGGDEQMLAAAGIVSLGGFEFGAGKTTEEHDADWPTSDFRWVETEHFRIGFALGPYKVTQKEKPKLLPELERLALVMPTVNPKKTRVLDPWLRTYLFAMRAEDLWDQMIEFLDVDEANFPDGTKLWDTTGKYWGEGPYLGQKGKYEVLMLPSQAAGSAWLRDQFGLITKLSQRWNVIDRDVLHLMIHTQQGDLKKDTALHGHMVFNLTQMMLNGFKHYSYELPPWLKEGIAHYMERRVSPDHNTFDSSEGAVAEMTRKANWEPPTRKLAQSGEAVSMARLMALEGYAGLELEHHYTTWSIIDFLQREHPGFLPQLMDRLSGMMNEEFISDGTGIEDVHRTAFKELLGMTYAQFDRAWTAWVLANYSTK